MARPGSLRAFLSLLRTLSQGELAVDWNGRPWMRVDADRREVEVDLAPLAAERGGVRGFLRATHTRLMPNVRLPRDLAKLGWKLTVRMDGRSILSAGRGASARTGYVRLRWAALPELVRLL